MKILIIDNLDSFTYNLVQIIEQTGKCGYDIIQNSRVDMEYVAGYDKILISPGPGLPVENPNIIEVIKRFSGVKSILGICLGHQSIAIAFGGILIQLEKILHGEATENFVTDKNEYLFNNIPEVFYAGRYHSWIVQKENLPECLKITSVDREGNIMSLSHVNYDVRGIQFHPESIMTIHGERIIQNWISH